MEFKKTGVAVLCIAILVLLWFAEKKLYASENEKIYCTPEQRVANACIEVYQPVCGYPAKKTFSNPCFACLDYEVEYYLEGECS